jgi:hypothetical protein
MEMSPPEECWLGGEMSKPAVGGKGQEERAGAGGRGRTERRATGVMHLLDAGNGDGVVLRDKSREEVSSKELRSMEEERNVRSSSSKDP